MLRSINKTMVLLALVSFASASELDEPVEANQVSETPTITGKIRFNNVFWKKDSFWRVSPETFWKKDGKTSFEGNMTHTGRDLSLWTNFTLKLSTEGEEKLITTMGKAGEQQTIVTRQETEYAGHMTIPREGSEWEGDSSSSTDECRLTIVTDKILVTGVEDIGEDITTIRKSLRLEWNAQRKTHLNCGYRPRFGDHPRGEDNRHWTFTARGKSASFEGGAFKGKIHTHMENELLRHSGKYQYYMWENTERSTTEIEREFSFDLELN